MFAGRNTTQSQEGFASLVGEGLACFRGHVDSQTIRWKHCCVTVFIWKFKEVPT